MDLLLTTKTLLSDHASPGERILFLEQATPSSMGDWTLLEIEEADDKVGTPRFCPNCGSHIGLLTAEHGCASCGKTTCDECSIWVPVVVHKEERVSFSCLIYFIMFQKSSFSFMRFLL